jgi:hypothetical protein
MNAQRVARPALDVIEHELFTLDWAETEVVRCRNSNRAGKAQVEAMSLGSLRARVGRLEDGAL